MLANSQLYPYYAVGGAAATGYRLGRRLGRWYANRRAPPRGGGARASALRRGRSYKGVDKKFLKNYLTLTESKFIDTAITETPIAGTSDVVDINVVGIGDTDSLRDGENLLVTSVQYNIHCTADANITKGTICRLLLVLKRDVRGATVTIPNLFVSDTIISMRQVQNSKNFKILSAKNFVIQPPDIAGDQKVVMIRFYKKFKVPIKVKYLSTAATIAGIDRNSLHLIFMTDATATFLPSFSGQVRVTFKDI